MERMQADRKRVFDASPAKSPLKTPSSKTPFLTPFGSGSGSTIDSPQILSPLNGRRPARAPGQVQMPMGYRPPRQAPNAKHGRPQLINVIDDDDSPIARNHGAVPSNVPPVPPPHFGSPSHNKASRQHVDLSTPPHRPLSSRPVIGSSSKGPPPQPMHGSPTFKGPVELLSADVLGETRSPHTLRRPEGINMVGPKAPVQHDAPQFDWVEPAPPNTGPPVTNQEKEKLIKELFESQAEMADGDDSAENQTEALVKRSKVDGLVCSLMPHQVLGLDWLRSREAGAHKAGILADDMGLGKTVQMIALVLSNRASAKDPTIRFRPSKDTKDKSKKPPEEVDPKTLPRPTLIVAPLAVIAQWADEFKNKTDCGIKVLVHHGKTKAKTGVQLANYDVVVTTYDTCKVELGHYQKAMNTPADELKSKKKTKKRSTLPVARDSEDESSSSAEESTDSEDELQSPTRPFGGRSGRGGRGRGRGRGGRGGSTASGRAPASTHPLFELGWLRIVLDEAQNVKNYRTKGSEAVCLLGERAEARWCLSGTPIQNNVMELYALLKFLRVPPFNDMETFKNLIATPLQSTSSQNRVNWALKRLRALLGPLLLRRTKDTELDGKKLIQLPPRQVHLLTFEFADPAEREFYHSLELKMRNMIENDQESTTEKIGHIQALVMLLRLRQACNHPALTMTKKDVDADAVAPPPPKPQGQPHDDDADELAMALERMTVTKRCDLCNVLLPSDFEGVHCNACAAQVAQANQKRNWKKAMTTSSKIDKMLETLAQIRDGTASEDDDDKPGGSQVVQDKKVGKDKSIVFSQFTSFLDLVEPFLRREGYKYVRYDGSMPPTAREAALKGIRSDPQVTVILISFRSGSTGLNLTCCNHVLLMDLWWNPQLEEQAFDRAHRLGQERKVHVYKLAIEHSVEQRLLEVQEKKRQLANSALSGEKLEKGGSRAKLSWQELMYLFNVNAQ